MSKPQERIELEVRQALKAQDKLELSTLRMLLNAIKNEQIRTGRDVDEATFLALVRRSIKQRLDSVELYRQGEREDLAQKEQQEVEILERYLPPQVGEDEIRDAIRELVERESLSGPQGIGPVMKSMIARFGSAADGATINRLAREILNGES
jgi:uncharacterized protein YqeY